MNDEVRQRRWLNAGAVVVCGVVLVVAAALYGLPLAVLLTACGLLILVVWLLWTSLLSLNGEAELTLEEAIGLAAPRAEEEQKRSVLRALKDLEYERRVGKVSEEDYTALSARYREQAKALLLELDRSLDAARAAAEKRVERYLGASDARVTPGTKKHKKHRKEQRPIVNETVTHADAEARLGPSRRCESCGYRNALQLAVCASCSKPLAGRGAVLCRACPAVYDAGLAQCPTCGVSREGA